MVCDACVFAFDTLLGLIVPGLENNVLKELIIEVCVALDIVSEVECEGAVNNYWPPIMYIIDKQPLVSGDNTCGIFLPGCGNTTAHDWTIGDLPGTKPPVIPPALPDVRWSSSFI